MLLCSHVCLCVRGYACACFFWKQSRVSLAGLAAFWRYANRCLQALSGFLGVSGNIFTSAFSTWCISKMTEMWLCPDGIINDFYFEKTYFAGITVQIDAIAMSIKKVNLWALAFPWSTWRCVRILIDAAKTVISTMCWIFNLCCWQLLSAAMYLTTSIIYASKACVGAPLRAAL